MKKNISILIVLVLLVGGFIAYNKHNKNISNVCTLSQTEVNLYVNKVFSERADYIVQENELERQATDGSYRKIFTDKNNDVVLIEDKHSGESGFRTVYVIIKNKEVVKVTDELTQYNISPIEDPSSVPIITKDEFYVIDTKICTWYKQDKLIDQNASKEKEYLNVINEIILDAENIAKIDSYSKRKL